MNQYYRSKDIAMDLNISQRSVNHYKNDPEFPPIMWIGRMWFVKKIDYEAWKLAKTLKGGNK
jgi:FixJ family two-component response regulator